MRTSDLVSGLDLYSIHTRVAPALLASAPALSLGLSFLPLLSGTQKLWSLLALSLTTYAALAARRAGIKAQASLFALWGGAPTTSRLRYCENPNAGEVSRRHREVERALGHGLRLPDQSQEQADPPAADVEYNAAMRRIIGKVRDYPSARLVRMENRNYGYARNLYGLKRYGIICAVVALVLCLCSWLLLSWLGDWRDALPLILPTVVSIFAVTAWTRVDADFVKPSADAYADRVVDVLDDLPAASKTSRA
jgi:hypothetical protein